MDLRKIKKKVSDLKNDKIEIPLTQEEKEKIIDLAKAEGLPIATFCRWKLLKS